MGPGMEIILFDTRNLFGQRRYYFRIVDAGNREPLAQSEGYNSIEARAKTANRFASLLGAKIIHGRRK